MQKEELFQEKMSGVLYRTQDRLEQVIGRGFFQWIEADESRHLQYKNIIDILDTDLKSSMRVLDYNKMFYLLDRYEEEMMALQQRFVDESKLKKADLIKNKMAFFDEFRPIEELPPMIPESTIPSQYVLPGMVNKLNQIANQIKEDTTDYEF